MPVKHYTSVAEYCPSVGQCIFGLECRFCFLVNTTVFSHVEEGETASSQNFLSGSQEEK